MKLVVLSGIDGTGKTTLASRIVAGLVAEGISARYAYMRTRPVLARLAMSIGRAVWLRGTDPWADYPSFTRRRTEALQNRALGFGYASTVIVDYFAQVWPRLLWIRRGTSILIVDRYWMDTVVSDIAVHLGLTYRQTSQLVEMGQRLLPRPTLTLILDSPAEVALRRKADIPGLGYLEERRRYFLAVADERNIKLLDAEQSADDVYRSAMTAVVAAVLRDEHR